MWIHIRSRNRPKDTQIMLSFHIYEITSEYIWELLFGTFLGYQNSWFLIILTLFHETHHISYHFLVWAMRFVKYALWATVSWSIFDTSRKHNGQAFSSNCAPRLCNRCNHSQSPGQHMWQSQCQGPWPYSKSSKTVTVEVRCSCWELKPFQR